MGSDTDIQVGKTTSGSIFDGTTVMSPFTDLISGAPVMGYGSVLGMVGAAVNVSGYGSRFQYVSRSLPLQFKNFPARFMFQKFQ